MYLDAFYVQLPFKQDPTMSSYSPALKGNVFLRRMDVWTKIAVNWPKLPQFIKKRRPHEINMEERRSAEKGDVSFMKAAIFIAVTKF